MKNFIMVICFATFVARAQNLVPNGNFEANPQNYHGGTNPIDYYSGTYTGNWFTDAFNISTHHRFDDDMEGTWYVAKAEKTYGGGKRRDSVNFPKNQTV